MSRSCFLMFVVGLGRDIVRRGGPPRALRGAGLRANRAGGAGARGGGLAAAGGGARRPGTPRVRTGRRARACARTRTRTREPSGHRNCTIICVNRVDSILSAVKY